MPHGFPEDEAGLSVAPSYKPAIICGCCRTSPPYDAAVTETANRSAFGLPVPATGSGPAATDHVSEKSQDRNLKEYDDLTRNRLMILSDSGYSCRGLFRPGEWVRAEKNIEMHAYRYNGAKYSTSKGFRLNADRDRFPRPYRPASGKMPLPASNRLSGQESRKEIGMRPKIIAKIA